MLAATGNMGKIYRLGAAGARGTYESPVFDAGSVAQWGRLRWQGETARAPIALRTRIGQQPAAGRTWSDWSEPLPMQRARRSRVPMRAFCSTKPKLTGTGATIENVSAAYLPQNNPPVVHSITVLTTVTPAADCARRPAVDGERGDDALQRHGDRYRRCGAGEFHRHADADAVARGRSSSS